MARSKKEISDDVVEEESSVREVIVEKKSGFNTIEVIIIMIIAMLFGGLIGSVITYTRPSVKGNKVPRDLAELVSTYNTILDTYYDKLDKEELLNSAVRGMVDYLDDPYSTYMSKKEAESFNETVNGEYKGIGARVTLVLDKAVVHSIFENSPAEKAGLKKGDIFKEIDKESVADKSLSEITSLLKGKKEGSKVVLKIERDGKDKELTLVSGSVEIPSVASKIMSFNDQKVGVLTVDIFAANTYNQFKNKLEKLEKKNINSLIIDVRGNPGGQLNQVTKVLSLFMNKDKILYQTEIKNKKKAVYASTKEAREYDVVVLTNKSSASASEILAAALKESYGAKLVGMTTYGKGTVQKSYALSNGANIKYTTEKWLTPTAKSIDKIGIKPDYEIEVSEEYINNQTDNTDNQLQKALEVITQKSSE